MVVGSDSADAQESEEDQGAYFYDYDEDEAEGDGEGDGLDEDDEDDFVVEDDGRAAELPGEYLACPVTVAMTQADRTVFFDVSAEFQTVQPMGQQFAIVVQYHVSHPSSLLIAPHDLSH